MTTPLYYALLADGESDRALLHIILWTLRDLWPDGEFARPDFFSRKALPIDERLREICEQYQPNLVFVHRDAESIPYDARLTEIPVQDRVVPVIPVRMTEAWLLINEAALRKAADNPKGRVRLELPELNKLEHIDAKKVLHESLLKASGYTGRRRKKFKVERATRRLAELIDDFSLLKQLNAYNRFRSSLQDALRLVGKKNPARLR